VDATKVQRSAPKRNEHCANDSYILETILHKYNPHKIPGGQVSVEVEVWVQEITTISDITSDFQLDIYISEMWLDPSLDYSWMEPCKYNLSLNSVLLEKLWTPNSCFINSKTADIHRSPFPNIFLLIYANGSGTFKHRTIQILFVRKHRDLRKVNIKQQRFFLFQVPREKRCD
jgi:hypothetical protein